MVDDFEAIMIPKARLSEGIVGRMRASAMTLTAGRKHGIYKYYLNGSEAARRGECQHKTTYLCVIRVQGVEYRLDKGSFWSG